MARRYQVDVHGIDLSNNMLDIAREHRETMDPEVKHRVQFHLEDATTMQLPKNFYDVVYSRDAIMHIENKLPLYKKLLSCLKPGGQLLVSEYCHGEKEHSQKFKTYVKKYRYDLLPVVQYGDIITRAGFKNVVAKDTSNMMLDTLNMEINKFSKIHDKFIKKFTEEDYNYIMTVWKQKTDMVKDRDQV